MRVAAAAADGIVQSETGHHPPVTIQRVRHVTRLGLAGGLVFEREAGVVRLGHPVPHGYDHLGPARALHRHQLR